MQAEVTRLFESPTLQIFDWHCRQAVGTTSGIEYTRQFEITFTRSGRFVQEEHRQRHHIDSSAVLLKNPGVEYSVTHQSEVRDVCTVFQTNGSLLEELLQKYWQKATHSSAPSVSFPIPLLQSTPRLDYLHFQILLLCQDGCHAGASLKLELLFLDLLEELYSEFFGRPKNYFPDPQRYDHHLAIVERGKEYLLRNFAEDIKLNNVARNSFASEFHFSRLFKAVAGKSPYRYLLEVRLKHAAMLLRNTRMSVTQICFDAGFNNLTHFISTFTRLFGASPSRYRSSASLP